jgi:hypothetical protein
MKQFAYRRLPEWNGIVILTQAEEEEEAFTKNGFVGINHHDGGLSGALGVVAV